MNTIAQESNDHTHAETAQVTATLDALHAEAKASKLPAEQVAARLAQIADETGWKVAWLSQGMSKRNAEDALADEREEAARLTPEERAKRLGDAFEKSHAALAMVAKWQLDIATRAEPGLHEAARAARMATTASLADLREATAERDAQRARTDLVMDDLRKQADGLREARAAVKAWMEG